MLKLADIKFPITFESRGVGHYVFTDEKTCHNVWLHSDKLSPSTMEIQHFIDAHNQHYNSIRDYGYAMPGYTCLHTSHIRARCYQCAHRNAQRFRWST